MGSCAIMQPTYLPWIGYFGLMSIVDKFVFLDHVQLEKRSWQVRNRIKGPNGEILLSIPVKNTKPRHELRICDAVLDEGMDWRRKHLKSIELNYRKAGYFTEVFDFIADLYHFDTAYLFEFTENIIKSIAWEMGIRTRVLSSRSFYEGNSGKDELLADICEQLGCEYYVSVIGSAGYIEKETPGGLLAKRGIKVVYFNFDHPVYPQLHGKFEPFMSVIDLCFNVGFSRGLEIISGGIRPPIPAEQVWRNLHGEIVS